MSLKLKGAFAIFISSLILIPISGSTHGWKKFFDLRVTLLLLENRVNKFP